MTAEFAGRVPTLWHGRGVARQMARRLTAGRETLVIADSATVNPVLVGHSDRTLKVDPSSVDVTTVAAIAREIVRRRPDVILAVGGGTVIDASKIAALALAPGRMFDYAIGHATRSALTVLPDAPPPVDIVAVPTTLGTSSETNRVGVLKNASGNRLIVGRSLSPRHAILDPYNLTSLTRAAVREGALEAFLRLGGAATSPQRNVRGNSDAVAIGKAILETATRDSASAAGRLRLARLSAATQRSGALRGDDPYSARHWYLANEVAFALDVRKMGATAAVIGEIWRRIWAGDRRWGDRRSLEDFWTGVSGGLAFPADPPAGIARVIDRWGIMLPQRPSVAEFSRIAAATESSWGGTRPMLPGLVAADFCEVLRDSRWSPQPVGGVRRPSKFSSEEVNHMNKGIEKLIDFQELEEMEAPSWESFYRGVISALILIGIGAAAAT